MSNTELGFSAILASFIALPAIAKLSAEGLEWLFSKIKLRKPPKREARKVSLRP